MQQSVRKGQILVVEDENIVALDIRQSLNRLGYEVPAVVATGEEAVAAARFWQPDLVLMDIRLRGPMDGIEAATHIRHDQRLPVVYLTAFADTKTLDRAKTTEPFGYVLKPFEDRELNSTIEMALYRHKMETRLQENERWLDTTLRSIGDAVIATDSVGRISFMNPVAERLTGYPTAKVSGTLFDNVLQVYTQSSGKSQPVSVVQPQSDINRVRTCDDATLRIPSGKSIPVDCTIAPLLDEGRLVGSVVIFRDISRRKNAEKALVASEQRFRALFEQAQTALLTSELHNQINRSLMSSVNMREILQAIVDGVGQVVGARFVFLHMVKEQTGKLRSAIFGAGQEGSAGGQLDPNQHWPRLVELVLQDRRPIHVRRTAQRSDTGQRSPLGDSHFAIPVWNPLTDHPQGKDFGAVVAVPLIHQGKALGVLTAVNLVSDPPLTEREMELMLVIANQATVAIENAGMFQEAEQRAADLSRSNAELTQFAYVVSRDLQTPLHTLQGYAQLLAHRQAGQDRDADDFLRNILAGVEEMNGLIGDLLTFSRLDTGEMSFAIVHSEQILERTLTSLQAIIQDSQATITHDPMPLLSVDPIQFEQLLYTLISNSLQFPDIHPPRIHIGVRVEKSEYQFSITDNGVGISPEYQEQLSLPSHRIRSRPNARGAGVGLAISKKIVEAHGGRIWYESRPGKGTTFYFALPIG